MSTESQDTVGQRYDVLGDSCIPEYKNDYFITNILNLQSVCHNDIVKLAEIIENYIIEVKIKSTIFVQHHCR